MVVVTARIFSQSVCAVLSHHGDSCPNDFAPDLGDLNTASVLHGFVCQAWMDKRRRRLGCVDACCTILSLVADDRQEAFERCQALRNSFIGNLTSALIGCPLLAAACLFASHVCFRLARRPQKKRPPRRSEQVTHRASGA